MLEKAFSEIMVRVLAADASSTEFKKQAHEAKAEVSPASIDLTLILYLLTVSDRLSETVSCGEKS